MDVNKATKNIAAYVFKYLFNDIIEYNIFYVVNEFLNFEIPLFFIFSTNN